MFEAGQQVVCVDASDTHSDKIQELQEGRIYTIRWAGDYHGDRLGGKYHRAIACVRLLEVPHRAPPYMLPEHADMPFAAARFRPIKATDISIFQQMLAPREIEVV